MDTRGDTNEATPPLEAEVDTADTIGQGALEAPRFPDTSSPKPNELVNFGEDGLLAEITRSQFRFIFGSILLSYFVSEEVNHLGRCCQLLMTADRYVRLYLDGIESSCNYFVLQRFQLCILALHGFPSDLYLPSTAPWTTFRHHW
jgi:hypothetical protein